MLSAIVCFRPETDASCSQKMNKMTITRVFVILALCWMQSANAARHSLTYITTASSGVTSFPEYVAVGMMDGVVIYRYDSNNEKAEPRQDWMSQQSSDNLEYLNFNTRRCKINQERAKNRVIYLKERFNHTGELPSVSLLQKTPSSPIVCHATGFYPPRAKLFWTKDGEIIKDNYTEVLPNHDGTYQMRARLKLPDLSETWERFTCVFQLDGVNLTTKLEKAILIKWKPDQTVPVAVSVPVVVFLLVAAAAVIGVVMRRRGGKSAETDSNSSEEALNPLKPPTEATAHVFLSVGPSDVLVEPQPEAT
ncbi:major histocompatibility complex class I-related gene protein-like isoform 4-T4 [Synchiropus picturatus]